MSKHEQHCPTVALIFAGGVGRRMNSSAGPKQFLELYGKPIIVRTLEHFQNHPEVDEIVISCVESGIEKVERYLQQFSLSKVVRVVPGGETGQLSIRNGLLALKERHSEALVLIHDGVRPMIDAATISRNIEAARACGGAITICPVVESLILTNQEGALESVIERNRCRVARAPQTYYLSDLLQAHEKAFAAGRTEYIDSLSLMQEFGAPVTLVDGPIENIKITTPQDFYLYKALVEAHEDRTHWVL